MMECVVRFNCACNYDCFFVRIISSSTANHPNSSFDTIVSSTAQLPDALFALALAKLKPAGRLVLLETAAVADELKGRLLLSGFVNARPINGCGE